MKLKPDFVSQVIEGARYLVPAGAEDFPGLLRGNETAAFIADCLREETSEAEIVSRMCACYDAPRDLIAGDVRKVLETLRTAHALEE